MCGFAPFVNISLCKLDSVENESENAFAYFLILRNLKSSNWWWYVVECPYIVRVSSYASWPMFDLKGLGKNSGLKNFTVLCLA